MQNIPHPLFAPATQRAENDDFDLNDIFAEYFSNEFDTDPLNAYTGAMANYSGGATAVASGLGLGPASGFLPTGGIRTAFHHGSGGNTNPTAGYIVGGGITGSLAPPPLSKKPRHEDAFQLQQQPMFLQQQPMPMNLDSNSTIEQAMMLAAAQPQQHAAQQLQQINLPIGVGIRLGGVGGVMASQASANQTAVAGMAAQQQLQQFMWAQQQQQQQQGLMNATEEGPKVAVAERRLRNREHAKRSRVRKKFMLESLQEEVRELQRENQSLRMIVQEHVPEQAMQIITECCTGNPLFDDTDFGGSEDGDTDGGSTMGGSARKPENLVKSDFTLMQCLATGQQSFVLSDPKLPDNPIVFASPGFYKLTGYTSKEVLGRNCRFLQGPGTNKNAISVIRKAIETGSDATVCLLNYKADGTPFWNQFFLASLRDSDNSIVNYVGVMTEVEPDAGANVLEERVNAALPLQGKDDKDLDYDV